MKQSRDLIRFTNNWDEFSDGLWLDKEFDFSQDFEIKSNKVIVQRSDGKRDQLPDFIIDANKINPVNRKIKYAEFSNIEIIAWRWSNGSSKSVIINRNNSFFYEAESRWLDCYPCLDKEANGHSVIEASIENTHIIHDKVLFIGGTINPSHLFGEYLPKLAIIEEPVTVVIFDDANWIREAINYVLPNINIKLIQLNPMNNLYCTRISLQNCILVEDMLENLELGLEISRRLISNGINLVLETSQSVNSILPKPKICHLSRLRFEIMVNNQKTCRDPLRLNRMHNYPEFLGLIKQSGAKILFPEIYSLKAMHHYIASANVVICEYGSLFAHLLINQPFHQRLHSGAAKLLFLMPKRFLDINDLYTLSEHRWLKSLNCENMIFLEGYPCLGLPSMEGSNYNDPCIYSESSIAMLRL